MCSKNKTRLNTICVVFSLVFFFNFVNKISTKKIKYFNVNARLINILVYNASVSYFCLFKNARILITTVETVPKKKKLINLILVFKICVHNLHIESIKNKINNEQRCSFFNKCTLWEVSQIIFRIY